MQDMGMQHSTADLCLYYDWTDLGLVIILSWIDDNLIVGSKPAVAVTKQELMSCFDCEDCGELDECVGCRLTRNKGEIKFPQGVLVQSFEDEFDVPKKKYATPAMGFYPKSSILTHMKDFLRSSYVCLYSLLD